MKSAVMLLVLALTPFVNASTMGYGQRNCQVLEEERGTLKNSDICILKISCESYALNDPENYKEVRLVGYCRPLDSGRCPKKPQNCLNDDSLTGADIPRIKPLADRPSMKPCGDSEAPKGTATITPLDANGNPINSNGGRQ